MIFNGYSASSCYVPAVGGRRRSCAPSRYRCGSTFQSKTDHRYAKLCRVKQTADKNSCPSLVMHFFKNNNNDHNLYDKDIRARFMFVPFKYINQKVCTNGNDYGNSFVFAASQSVNKMVLMMDLALFLQVIR